MLWENMKIDSENQQATGVQGRWLARNFSGRGAIDPVIPIIVTREHM